MNIAAVNELQACDEIKLEFNPQVLTRNRTWSAIAGSLHGLSRIIFSFIRVLEVKSLITAVIVRNSTQYHPDLPKLIVVKSIKKKYKGSQKNGSLLKVITTSKKGLCHSPLIFENKL